MSLLLYIGNHNLDVLYNYLYNMPTKRFDFGFSQEVFDIKFYLWHLVVESSCIRLSIYTKNIKQDNIFLNNIFQTNFFIY